MKSVTLIQYNHSFILNSTNPRVSRFSGEIDKLREFSPSLDIQGIGIKIDPEAATWQGRNGAEMNAERLSGPSAGVRKYDVLTCLAMVGIHGTPGLQTKVLRLICLITARYNWRSDELTVGQRDIAMMWSVTERTVKRDIKKLQEIGILTCTRPGVRGRVAAYRLNQRRIAELAEPTWTQVGPDFQARMQERFSDQVETQKVVSISAYAKRPKASEPILPTDKRCAAIVARIAEQAPDTYEAWFSRLEFLGFDAGVLRLRAPSRFLERYVETHLMSVLVAAIEEEAGPLERIVFEG